MVDIEKIQNIPQFAQFTSRQNEEQPAKQPCLPSLKPDTFESSAQCSEGKENLKQAEKIALYTLSPIVPIRRVTSVDENIENGNYAKAAGLVGLAAVNLPEDTRDLKAAARQIFKGRLPNYDYKNCQTPFSFFRGTLLEPFVNKLGKFGAKLHEWDIPLSETKFGQFLGKIFKFEIDYFNFERTSRFKPKVIIDESGKTVIKHILLFAYPVNGKPFAKLLGQTLLRIPVISVAALGLLEIPSIVKKIKNGDGAKGKLKDGSIQTAKSAINVAAIISGIGMVGALFNKKGPAFSLLGMGIGSVAGALLSKFAQKKIDNLE